MLATFFDFETTGRDPATARITELACVLYDLNTKRTLEAFSTLVYEDGYEIEPGAQAVTGISIDFIREFGKPPLLALASLNSMFARSVYCVGHNITAYDLKVLEAECSRQSIEIITPKSIDTRYDIEYPAHIETRKLGYLCQEMGIFAGDSHSALADVQANIKLFNKFPLHRTMELAASPNVWVRADVSYDDREKAKEQRYFWASQDKIWVKNIKEMFLPEERAKCSFPVLLVPSFKG